VHYHLKSNVLPQYQVLSISKANAVLIIIYLIQNFRIGFCETLWKSSRIRKLYRASIWKRTV